MPIKKDYMLKHGHLNTKPMLKKLLIWVLILLLLKIYYQMPKSD